MRNVQRATLSAQRLARMLSMQFFGAKIQMRPFSVIFKHFFRTWILHCWKQNGQDGHGQQLDCMIICCEWVAFQNWNVEVMHNNLAAARRKRILITWADNCSCLLLMFYYCPPKAKSNTMGNKSKGYLDISDYNHIIITEYFKHFGFWLTKLYALDFTH